jgi:SAM-dependent methyltransferase
MTNPGVALRNWWRVVKPGGYLIFYGPHRDLYEKKKQLPSNWNSDHKYFFLLDEDDPPDTLGVLPLIKKSLRNYDIIVAKVCDEGHTITDPAIHSDGEYSFEIVLFKKK